MSTDAPDADDPVDLDLPADLRPWLHDLRSLGEPVPVLDLELARAAFSSRDLDAELVALWDSREHLEPVHRGEADEWQLSLSVGEADVLLTVVPEGARRRLVGAVSGEPLPALELEWPAGRAALALDDLGRFEHEVAAGPVRLRCTGPGTHVVSAWVTL